MQVIPVESTALATVGYDEARELLRVEFCGRAIYHYFGVPAAVHQGLLGASSKGSYFNQAIRDSPSRLSASTARSTCSQASTNPHPGSTD